MSDRLRLFVAARVPEEQRDRLASVVAPWRERLPGPRWTDPAGQHVTLKFLGGVDAGLLGEVVEVLARAAHAASPADLRLATFGAFPSRTRMRVLWAGLADPADALAAVAEALAAGFEELGFAREAREFHPHLTLARCRTPRRFPEDLSDDLLNGFPPFRWREVVLYRSNLSPKGARYEAVESLPLGTGGVASK